MSKFTLDKNCDSNIKDSIKTIMEEYVNGLTDYERLKNSFEDSLSSLFWSSSKCVRFNQKRLINFFNVYMKDILQDRETNYTSHFCGKPIKKREAIVFTGKLEDVILRISIQKKKNYLSDFQSILCSSSTDKKTPIYVLNTNEEAWDVAQKRWEIKNNIENIIDKLLGKISRETLYNNKHSLCGELTSVVNDAFNFRIFNNDYSRYSGLLEKILKAEDFNQPLKSLFKSVELGYDPTVGKIKVYLIY
jgi:hypothetical protein